jgi:hypothetical protein
MHFLLVKSLFCPNEYYYTITLKSLIKINMFFSLIKHKFNKNPTNDNQTNDDHPNNIMIDIYCIGWVNNFTNHVIKFLESNLTDIDNIDTNFFDLNYGKYHTLNQMIDYVKSHIVYDFVIYMDHDVYFDVNCVNDFFNLRYLIDHQINNKNLGLIALNQKKDIRHKKDIYENEENFMNYRIIFPSCTGSIANGCFMISPNTLIQIPHFELFSIYGLDDYYLDKQLIKMNFLNVVIDNVYVIHPYDNNDKYTAWKKNKILKMINNHSHSHNNHDDYFQQIQDCNNFWSDIQ